MTTLSGAVTLPELDPLAAALALQASLGTGVDSAAFDPAMRLIDPVTVTDAVLLASTIAETDYPAWSAATSYAIGDLVMRTSTHRVYVALAAGVDSGVPESTPARWRRVGSTNRWRMFDESVGSRSTAAGSLTVRLQPGYSDALALLDIKASTAVVLVSDSAGTVKYARVADLTGLAIVDWWEYFTAEATPRTDLVLTGLPISASDVLEVSLYGSTVELGVLSVGTETKLGLPQYGLGLGIADYSRKTTDEFGETSIVERAFAKRLTPRLAIERDDTAKVYRTLARIRARPVVWIPSTASGYEVLAVYGYWKDFRIDVAYPSMNYCSLEIEGLI